MKNETTATRLMLAMERKGWKAADLARYTGIGKSSISQYLSGKHAPGNLSAGKMAETLGVSPVWLMGYDVPMYEPLRLKGMDTNEETERTWLDTQEATAKMELLNKENRQKVLSYMESLYQIQAAEAALMEGEQKWKN